VRGHDSGVSVKPAHPSTKTFEEPAEGESLDFSADLFVSSSEKIDLPEGHHDFDEIYGEPLRMQEGFDLDIELAGYDDVGDVCRGCPYFQ